MDVVSHFIRHIQKIPFPSFFPAFYSTTFTYISAALLPAANAKVTAFVAMTVKEFYVRRKGFLNINRRLLDFTVYIKDSTY